MNLHTAPTTTRERRISASGARRGRRIWSAVRHFPGHTDSPSESAVGAMTGITDMRRHDPARRPQPEVAARMNAR